MARKCFVCGKKPLKGMAVSHSHHRTRRYWFPNLQKINILVGGKKRKEYVCAKCLKSGKVAKAI